MARPLRLRTLVVSLLAIALSSGCAPSVHVASPPSPPLHHPQLATVLAADRVPETPLILAIHGDPQKAAYASPAEWPYLSAQCHARPANVETDGHADAFGTFNPTLGHVHVDWALPIYAEVRGPTVIPFTLKLFHVAGRVTNIWGSPIGHIRWDDSGVEETGSEISEGLTGDPTGLVVRSGTLTIDPTTTSPVYTPVPRGWFFADLAVRTQFETGVRLDAHILASLYSVIDPTAPETPPLTATDPNLQANCQLIGPLDSNSPFGSAISELRAYLPLGPISAPYPYLPVVYNYGGTISGGRFEQRLDPDLHNGITGRLLATADVDDTAHVLQPLPTQLDPAVLGPGLHHVSNIWQQQSGDGAANVAAGEEVWALLVIPVTVTATPQPIVTCQDAKADNVDKLLPCTYVVGPVHLAASPDGATMPPEKQLVDATGVVWTISVDEEIQRNGGSSNGGFGTKVIFKGGSIFTLGLDAVWYQWWENRGWLPGAPQ